MNLENKGFLDMVDSAANINWLKAPSSRRTFLGMSATASLLLASCGTPRATEAPIQPGVKRTEGLWTPREVVSLALSMIQETNLEGISGAGKLLMDNQFIRPSLSTICSLFDDSRLITVSTVSLGKPDIAAESQVSEFGPKTLVLVKSKDSNEVRKITAPQGLSFKSITLNKDVLDRASDLTIKFMVAKELYWDTKAIDLATTAYSAEDDFELPRSKDLLDTVRMYEFDNVIQGVPMTILIDVWAHFLELPDYLTAKDSGGFTGGDAKLEASLFGELATYFTDRDILGKKDDKYTWLVDQVTLRKSWMYIAQQVVDRFKEVQGLQ